MAARHAIVDIGGKITIYIVMFFCNGCLKDGSAALGWVPAPSVVRDA